MVKGQLKSLFSFKNAIPPYLHQSGNNKKKSSHVGKKKKLLLFKEKVKYFFIALQYN